MANKIRNLAVVAALCGLSCVPATAQVTDLDRQNADLNQRMASAVSEVRLYLTLYDQLGRIEVAQGRLAAGESDARLRTEAERVSNSGATGRDALRGQHRQAATAWIAALNARAQNTTWPAGGAALWRPMFDEAIQRVSRDYAIYLSAGYDPVPVLRELAKLEGWVHGRTGPGANPFDGQEQRLADALAAGPARAMMAAALGITDSRGQAKPQPSAEAIARAAHAPSVVTERRTVDPPDRPVPARGRLAILAAGKDYDVVGVGGNGNPDGQADIHLTIDVELDHPDQIVAISMKSADARGDAVALHQWDTRDTAHSLLAIYVIGKRLNPTHVPSIGSFQHARFDVFGADPGWYAPGLFVRVEVLLANGQVLASFGQITQAASHTTAPQPPQEGRNIGAIDVTMATYGASCGAPQNNVTRFVKAACDGRATCDYRVDHTQIGDPASGCRKDFLILWSCGPGGGTGYVEVPAEATGKTARLSCPPGR